MNKIKRIAILIEWKKNRIWGMNPHATATATFENGESMSSPVFKCSGCGYDKESTVLADVFNHFLKGYIHSESEPPYGVQGDTFSGGIGVSSYYRIAQWIGGELEHVSATKNSDVYIFTMI